MKRLFIIFCLCILIPHTIQAINPIQWGVTIGASRSTIKDNPYSSVDPKWGFHGGVKAILPLQGFFYLEGSALFSGKGYKADWYVNNDQPPAGTPSNENGGSELTRTSYYLDIPIHIGYKYPFIHGVSLYASVGPYVGVGLLGKEETHSGTYKESVDLYETGSGDKRFDFGMGFRVGAELGNHFQLGFGYDWGFIKSSVDDDSQNRNLLFSLSYLF